ncbi:MAG TPA: hypothetical protein VLB44_12855, partial [Kofleriaceae bacterium]|nr:hypothetical protein [Kofleriaceae bacterium]
MPLSLDNTDALIASGPSILRTMRARTSSEYSIIRIRSRPEVGQIEAATTLTQGEERRRVRKQLDDDFLDCSSDKEFHTGSTSAVSRYMPSCSAERRQSQGINAERRVEHHNRSCNGAKTRLTGVGHQASQMSPSPCSRRV